ncbi:hypothetical protein HYC85_022438 [Camellia sinensis]|uniref:TATA-box-binding protein n=1 Tax=Camellia sinensis TaxID=4442 RepID=A0A7J7GN16_CAMSI|nr:hypothetical protein HYC85_022438 [Camellia sinensis]
MADQVLEGSQPVDLSKHPSGIVPTLQNIVSTVNLDCKLDLKAIALQARNAEYNPKRFAAVIMRIRDPKTTALIFASGKMVCTGAKSEQLSKLAARKDFKIQNIVGSCDYEPELFPGLIYRMKQPKIVLLIFVSGKIVLTGAKVRDETYTAFENIYPTVFEEGMSSMVFECKSLLLSLGLLLKVVLNCEYVKTDMRIQMDLAICAWMMLVLPYVSDA